MKLKFLGATQTVTGSKYLVESNGYRVLVDCGLFQGLKKLRLRNWEEFPVKPESINAVVLTHAHLDHSGYLPILKKRGFNGAIYCTSGTKDLCKILLPDAGKLQEEEATYANRKGFSKHTPALPLFTKEDSESVLENFKAVEFNKEINLNEDLKISFSPSGHILGSAFVTLKGEGKSVVFSGDLGRSEDLIIRPPVAIKEADYLLIESTYGDRLHSSESPVDRLASVINKTTKRNGVVIIPAFSVGRTQSYLYAIYLLKSQKRIQDVPVYLNSPMSINAMGIYCEHQSEHRLNPAQCRSMCDVATYVHTVEESKNLNKMKGPMIIISASGMLTGGRVLHHLNEFGPDPKNTILLSGYQAVGTRGQALLAGAKSIKMHGQMVPIRAETEVIGGFSAHADQSEILSWLGNFSRPPKQSFVTHGEIESSLELQKKIQQKLKWNAKVPEYLEEVELS